MATSVPDSSSIFRTTDQKKTPHRQKDEPSARKSWMSERYGTATALNNISVSEKIIAITSW